MNDEELVREIRRTHRGQLIHEFLCPACAHRDHVQCEEQCTYCSVRCQCVCQRWAIPITGVDGR